MPSDADTVIVKRGELYEQVWSQPLRAVGGEYRVSDVALKKICRKLDVPLSPRGFWARKAVGREGPRPQLPAAKDGQPTEHRIEQRGDPASDADLAPEARALIARERAHDLDVIVPNVLRNPHPLVGAAANLLRKAKAPDTFLLRRRMQCLDVTATGDALERALRIMDALLRAMEQRGFRVEVTKPGEPVGGQHVYDQGGSSRTGVWIAESFVEFGIREDTTTIKLPPSPSHAGRGSRWESALSAWEPGPRTELRPNGKLTLSIKNASTRGARQRWRDGERGRLEGRLNDFVAGVIEAADRQRIAGIEAERRRREWNGRERRREEEVRRREEEVQRAYDLDSRVQDWAHVKAVREFLHAVEADAEAREENIGPDTDLVRWFAWARRRADQVEADAIRNIACLRPIPPT